MEESRATQVWDFIQKYLWRCVTSLAGLVLLFYEVMQEAPADKWVMLAALTMMGLIPTTLFDGMVKKGLPGGDK